ncbi:MAG TPA: succinyl-diaminopimelate desuccinylase [Steroidobacteraceae bacterium]|nr:succinyl-diaminopimelate desuccinylase [Steroidobacteraceae bacterium]
MKRHSPTVELTRELVARRSVTPEDAGCQDILIARLAALGFSVERLRFGEVDNFWALRRGGPGPVLCFAGHTDVVPAGPAERWTSDPFEPVIRDGRLYGRGAADMKSGLAAMVTAAEEFLGRRRAHAGAIAFLVTSDEEGKSVDGTRRVVEWLQAQGQRIDLCLIAEPSSLERFGDNIRIGRRGSLSARLTVHGVQGHVAYPERADNPVHRLAPALAELVARHWDDGHGHFKPTSFQVSNINAGTGAPNVIPGELVLRFNLRWSPAQTLDGLRQTVQGILDRHGLRYAIDWYEAGLPFYSPPGILATAASEAVEALTGQRPEATTGGGTSDGRFIAPMGAEIVELGVRNESIHKLDENCAVAEIDLLHRALVGTLERLLPPA